MSRLNAWLRGFRDRHGATVARQAPERVVVGNEPGEGLITSLSPQSGWQKGDVILDLYEITDIHEGGAMGLVYRAHHRVWNIDLAIKSPRPELFERLSHKVLFTRECETWTKLGLHPQLVSCYYVRAIDDVPRVFAEYVEGGTLADWIDSKRLYEGSSEAVLLRILDIAIQFAWGLSYAHTKGVVHRDVKPNNVLLTPTGRVKVTDFGIAKAFDVVRGHTGEQARGPSPLSTIGVMTRSYRSPEQAAGSPLSFKTDIWSWAVSVLEMLCGGILWDDGQVADETLGLLRRGTIRNIPVTNLPSELAVLLVEALRQTPDSRPSSMYEISQRLLSVYELSAASPYPFADLRRSICQPVAVEQEVRTGADTSNRALSLLDLGKPEEALAMLQAWLHDNPCEPTPWCNEALLRVGLNRTTADRVARDFSEHIAPSRPQWGVLGVEPDRFVSFIAAHYVKSEDGSIVGLRWIDGGRHLLSISADGNMRFWGWSAVGLQQVRHILASPVAPNVTGLWPLDEHWIVVGYSDGSLDLRGLSDGEVISSKLLIPSYEPPSGVVYGTTRPVSNAVRGIVHISGSGRVLVFLENADNFILKLPELEIICEWHERRDSNSACASPADCRFFILAEPQGRLRLYLNDKQETHRLIYAEHTVTKYNQAYQKTGTAREMVPVTAVDCSSDGTWFASGSRSGGVLLWSSENVFAAALDSKCPADREWLFEGPIKRLAFSYTGRELCEFAASLRESFHQ